MVIMQYVYSGGEIIQIWIKYGPSSQGDYHMPGQDMHTFTLESHENKIFHFNSDFV